MNATKYVLEKNSRGEAIIGDASLETFWTSEDIAVSDPQQELRFYNTMPSAESDVNQLQIVGIPYSAGSNHENSGVRHFPRTVRYLSTKTPLYPALEHEQSSGILDVNYQEQILVHCGINDCGDIVLEQHTSEALKQALEPCIQQFCSNASKFSFIGGDHSVTYHILKQLKENGLQILYLHFDAHLDCGSDPLRLDNEVHHGNFVRHLLREQLVEHVVQLGVRGLRSLGQYYEHPRLSCIPSQQLNRHSLHHLLQPLLRNNRHVYISFDVDVLDPGIFPYVDFSSAGGPPVHELFEIIRSLQDIPGIVGFDLVEGHGADLQHIPFQYDVVMHIFSRLLHMLNESKPITNGGNSDECQNRKIAK